MSACYLCASPAPHRQATHLTASQVPICDPCDVYHFGDVPVVKVTTKEPPAAKIEEAAKSARKWFAIGRSTSAGRTDVVSYTDGVRKQNFHVAVWRAGGCIFCGDTSSPRPAGNKMSHGKCFGTATAVDEELIEVAKDLIAEDRR